MFLRAKPLGSKRSSQADRIAVVSYSVGGGGAERVVIDLCRYLRSNGREVTSKIEEQFSPGSVYGKWLRLIDAGSARRPALLRYFFPGPIGE